jgi:signal transduction histidine kinase
MFRGGANSKMLVLPHPILLNCRRKCKDANGARLLMFGRGMPTASLSVGVYRSVLLAFLLASFAGSASIAAETKRVMILHSFGRDFRPWIAYAQGIRTELDRQSPWPLEIIDQSLMTAREPDEDPEVPFVEYLRAIFTKRPMDLIVSIGAPAAAFVQRRRQQLFPTTPTIFTAIEERRVQKTLLTEFDAVVAVSHTLPAIIENILKVLPDTKTIAVVNGNSANEKFWSEELRREFSPFADQVSFVWYDDRSFEDILKHAAALPPHSAIFWHLMSVDAAGVAHEGDTALRRLYAAANAPIFSYDGSFFGAETVGGPMHSVSNLSRMAASAAVSILGGERASDVKIPTSRFASPIFDWRLMQRWGISETTLPQGSEIYFREPSVWERYQTQILAIFAALLAQTGLIFWLLHEHRRRHLAETNSRNAMAELTAMNRRSLAGELSASIAHEVNQPLAGITTSAAAALRWLAAEPPNNDRARAALRHVVEAGHRAADVITNIRAMFAKDTNERSTLDINSVVFAVLSILRHDLQKNGVEIQADLDDRLPAVEGNKVQLQQVILNLTMNAIEAMHATQPRILKVRTELGKPATVHVSISDTGTGIDPANVDHVFGALFTTKERGMGMGLSICKSVIENHNGRIWVTTGSMRGTTFHFELPTKAAGHTKIAERTLENV